MSFSRDVATFLAAALIPAAAVGWLGLRALKNEEAALRREATLEVERQAGMAVRAVDTGLERAARDIGALSIDEARAEDAKALAQTFDQIASVTPSFAEAAVVTGDGNVLEPRTRVGRASGQEGDAACPGANAFIDGARHEAARTAVLACPEARDATGRWLFPVIAIDELGHAPDAGLATELVRFFESHASLMRPEERAIARDEVARLASLPEGLRARATAALDGNDGKASSLAPLLARVWRSEPALRALSGGEETRRFDGAGTAGVVRRVGDGVFVGLVVTPETLTRAALANPPLVPAAPGIVLEVAVPGARPEPNGIEATAFVSDGLGFRARLARPAELAEKTSRSARLLGALVAASAVVAVGLAALLFIRVRAARRTSELRTSFVAAVSHELKTPIASVQMLSELLAQGRVEEDERAEVAEALVREARRMGDTVERFLAYARMERGRLVARRAEVDAAALVRDRAKAFLGRHPGLRCEVDAPEALEADIDRAQIELVLDNLLENAAKYAPEGGPYRVRLRAEEDDVILSVSDSGPGVARALANRVFRPFERGDDRLSKATDGTGLGLALVRAAAEAHGGTAVLGEHEGRGATFVVRLPRHARMEKERT